MFVFCRIWCVRWQAFCYTCFFCSFSLWPPGITRPDLVVRRFSSLLLMLRFQSRTSRAFDDRFGHSLHPRTKAIPRSLFLPDERVLQQLSVFPSSPHDMTLLSGTSSVCSNDSRLRCSWTAHPSDQTESPEVELQISTSACHCDRLCPRWGWPSCFGVGMRR
jgi:hypothetical protein